MLPVTYLCFAPGAWARCNGSVLPSAAESQQLHVSKREEFFYPKFCNILLKRRQVLVFKVSQASVILSAVAGRRFLLN